MCLVGSLDEEGACADDLSYVEAFNLVGSCVQFGDDIVVLLNGPASAEEEVFPCCV